MKKIRFLLIVFLLLISISSCKKKKQYFDVTFVYENGSVITAVKVEKGQSVNYPSVNNKEGYYYTFDKSLDELSSIQSNVTVTAREEECLKTINYYIDSNLHFSEKIYYSEQVTLIKVPSIPGLTNLKWRYAGDLSRIDDEYQMSYNLEYDEIKSTISYYDGDQLLNLEPSVVNYGEEITLPTYSKEGYEFVGWYLSEISGTPYEKISCDEVRTYKLYARFMKLTPDQLSLGSTEHHFTGVKQVPNGSVFTYQPIMPEALNSKVTDYDWSTSNSKIATISMWSSITPKCSGYCVITAVSKVDRSIVVNGVFEMTSSGVVLSSLEEANTIKFYDVTFVGKDNEIIDTLKVKSKGSVFGPVPPIYEGYKFIGWDHELYDINENTTIKALYEEGENTYHGKKISFIGDSISTYQEYIPSGFSSFYPYPTGDVFNLHQTWWMKVVNALGGLLFVNNSYSGSCVYGTQTSATQNLSRIRHLILSGEAPDVVIIYMGSNDAAAGYTGNQFEGAYNKMIKNIKSLSEDTEIILCTLPESSLYLKETADVYNIIIKKIALENGFKVADLGKLNLKSHLIDSAHPNKSGMNLIAEQVLSDITD